MKFKCQRAILLSGLQNAQKAVSPRTTMPVLSGILLSAKGNEITLSATDLEMGIETKVPAHVMENGAVVLPAKIFVEIVRRLPEDMLVMETENEPNLVVLSSGRSEFRLNGMPAADFPSLPLPTLPVRAEVPQSLLQKMIRQTSFAVSTEESRAVLTGIYMCVSGDRLEMAATDAFQLVAREASFSGWDGEPKEVVVPGRIMAEIGRMMDGGDNPVEIRFSENQIFFYRDDLRIVSRLIEGKYPPYRQLFPKADGTKIIVRVQEFLEAIERASLLAKEGMNNLIRFQIEGDVLTIESNSPEVGRVHEEVAIKTMEGSDLTIAFNARYFMNILRVIDSEKAFLNFTGSLNPCVVTPVGEENFWSLVLPVRIR